MGTWVEAMRSGRFEDAWQISEATLAERDPATRDDAALPYHLRWVWDGRSFDDRQVLVRCYHGLGDTIQFARFLPLLARRAASLTVEVQPRLLPLLADLAEREFELRPFDPAHPLPPSECDLEITELDFALGARPDAAPPPYLCAQPAALPPRSVAFCYGAGDWDPSRCVPQELLAPLCRHAPCVTLMAEPCSLDVLNPGGCAFDMAETAALIAGSELVITVDTMVAHLAGAMGRPVWLLLKADPDWRWPTQGTSTPWYPSMRLYSQPRAGDWDSVLEQVDADLKARSTIMAER
ncbi:glycosyltransferase family 9 protein [Sphingomonas sp.]|uniref:glycosyltransferase family 9 protein n=1 Tax=Sphingomonas sp. TaxID=28214 RepID=UPI0025F2FE39|nr:glycosyltransferase family 9 protein [Sphingomonas sp.]